VETKTKGRSARLQNIPFAGLLTKPKGTSKVSSPEKEKQPVAVAHPQSRSDADASPPEGATLIGTDPLTTASQSGMMDTPPEAGTPPDSTQNLQKLHKKLKAAVFDGKDTEVKRILEKEEGLVNSKIPSDNGTVVHYIIRYGHGDKGTEKERLEQLRLLISESIPQVDWSATDRKGRTPLHLTCAHDRNYSEIAKFLLQHGANLNVLDSNETAPLLDAAAENSEKLVQILLQCDRTNISFTGPNLRTALHKAAWRGHLAIADKLLKHDPSIVDLPDKDGYTPLHDACRQDKAAMVEKLILAEANVTARTNGRSTPLHLAAQSNALGAAGVLLRAGASTTARNGANQTPADVAQRKGYNEMVELLRAPPKVENRLALIGTRLQVSFPTPSQQEASKAFSGFVWPSIDRGYGFDSFSVFDMLYGDDPRLKKSRLGKGAKVRWIHIPSNNVSPVPDRIILTHLNIQLTVALMNWIANLAQGEYVCVL
jgi:ankyrin repeat protein